jgi:hypothetical protein
LNWIGGTPPFRSSNGKSFSIVEHAPDSNDTSDVRIGLDHWVGPAAGGKAAIDGEEGSIWMRPGFVTR